MAGDSKRSGDRERFARARAAGARHLSARSTVAAARYLRRPDAIALTFVGGGTMLIPRALVPELEGAAPSTVASITVSPAGDALRWPGLDIDLHVPGLVERTFGAQMPAAGSAGTGSRRRTAKRTPNSKPTPATRARARKRLAP
jgi:hypothetical protein